MGFDVKKFNCCQEQEKEEDKYRRRCGCLKTSDKLKEVLKQFPPPPPPPPTVRAPPPSKLKSTCISAYCNHPHTVDFLEKSSCAAALSTKRSKHGDCNYSVTKPRTREGGVLWRVVSELVQLLQLFVTLTALAVYYLIYCYMQLLYCTVRSAIYFHNADRAMKVTLAVVTVTTLFVGFHLLVRIERLIGLTSD